MPWFPKQSVVVPVDFSAESLDAIEVGLALVDQPAHLHVVHVVIDITPLEAGEVWGVIDPQARIEQLEKAAQDSVWPIRNTRAFTLAVLLGEPAHGIANLRPGEARPS